MLFASLARQGFGWDLPAVPGNGAGVAVGRRAARAAYQGCQRPLVPVASNLSTASLRIFCRGTYPRLRASSIDAGQRVLGGEPGSDATRAATKNCYPPTSR